MKTVHDIFDAFGGPAALARAVGVTTEHATTMRRRKSIPVKYWPALLADARERKISIGDTDLIEIHSKHSGAAA